MTRYDKNDTSVSRWYDWGAFFVCLLVLCVRCMFTESPGIPTSHYTSLLTNDAVSLIISTALILTFCLWFVFSILSGTIRYKISWIEPGFIVFLTAGVIGIYAASDKRAAVTNLVMISSGIIAGIMLVQVMNNTTKVKILLIVMVALGLVNLYESYQQAFSTNQMLIDQYEEDPQSQLQTLGITAGTLNEYLYEHRLYSRDVRGFFKTSNSAGSFILLSIASAAVILTSRFKPDDKDTKGKVCLVRIIAFALVAAVMFLVMSKGAFAALFIAIMLLVFFGLFNKWIVKYRYICLFIILLAVIGTYVFIGMYGSSKGTLPGGNSMLVRWQYWSSTWEMLKDCWSTGAGPDNFGIYYTYYKIPAALETVRDPHNIFLAVLSQYGITGLIGLLLMITYPVVKNISDGNDNLPVFQKDPVSSRTWVVIFALLFAGILILRYIFLTTETSQSSSEMLFVFIYLHLVPAVVFAAGCFMLLVSERHFITESTFSKFASPVLICGVIAVIAANQIDFAIFEPGVWTAFWAVIACWISMKSPGTLHRNLRSGYMRLGLVIAAGLLFAVYLVFAVIPPVWAGVLQQKAMRGSGDIHGILHKAAHVDKLDDKSLALNCAAYIRRYTQTGEIELLKEAANCLREAANRNNASFKNFEKLGDLYMLLADEDPDDSERWLKAAVNAYDHALNRYPGSGRMNYKIAGAKEELNDEKGALMHYNRAVEIEDQYRAMFRKMYPGRDKIFSRLGEEKYQDALDKIKKLQSK